MAKKKGRSRRQGLISKGINAGVIALSMSTLLRIWLFEAGDANAKTRRTLQAYTGFGFDGSFIPSRLIEGYGPVAAGFAVGTVIKFIRKKFPLR